MYVSAVDQVNGMIDNFLRAENGDYDVDIEFK